MGDKCLRKIGNCMLKISDPGELIVYRYGGTSLVAVSLIHDYKGIQRVCQGLSVLIKGLNIEFRELRKKKDYSKLRLYRRCGMRVRRV